MAAAESILQQPNRVPWIVGGTLIALFLIGGVIAKPEEAPPAPPVPNPPENARALTVPTDRARTRNRALAYDSTSVAKAALAASTPGGTGRSSITNGAGVGLAWLVFLGSPLAFLAGAACARKSVAGWFDPIDE